MVISSKELMAEILQDADCAAALKNNNFNRIISFTNLRYGNDGTNALKTAFESCGIDILSGLTYVPSALFRNDINITDVIIPSNIKRIQMVAFSNSSITSLKFEEGCEKVGGSAFSNCKGLTEVLFPKSMLYINFGAFGGCSNLSKIDLSNVEEIGGGAFGRCPKLTEVTIPKTIKRIDEDSFDFATIKIVYEGNEEEFKSLLPNVVVNNITYLGK